MILPVVLIPAICITANVFLYPQVREEVRRYVKVGRRPDAPLKPPNPPRPGETVVAAEATVSFPPTDVAHGSNRLSEPEPLGSVPATQTGSRPRTGKPQDEGDIAAEMNARLEKSAESAEPKGNAVPPPASLRVESAHLDIARDVLAPRNQGFRDDLRATASSDRLESGDTAAEIASIPTDVARQEDPNDVDRPGAGGSGESDSLKHSAIANPATSSTTSGTAEASPTGDGFEVGAAHRGDAGSGESGASADANDDAPPLEPILWPRSKSDGTGGTPLVVAKPSVPPSRPDDSDGASFPESRRVRRLPPPEPVAGDTHHRIRSAAEAVAPIPLYPDTGYPPLFP